MLDIQCKSKKRFQYRSVLTGKTVITNYRSVPFPFSTTSPFCRLPFRPYTSYNKATCTCISCSYTKESFEMPYTDYLKRRALAFYNQGLAPSAIADALEAESWTATKQGLTKRYLETGSLGRHRNTRSHSTILRSRRSLGWTFRGSAYSQMIGDVNKTKPFGARGYTHNVCHYTLYNTLELHI